MKRSKYYHVYADYMDGLLEPALTKEIQIYISLNPAGAREFHEFKHARLAMKAKHQPEVTAEFLDNVRSKIAKEKESQAKSIFETLGAWLHVDPQFPTMRPAFVGVIAFAGLVGVLASLVLIKPSLEKPASVAGHKTIVKIEPNSSSNTVAEVSVHIAPTQGHPSEATVSQVDEPISETIVVSVPEVKVDSVVPDYHIDIHTTKPFEMNDRVDRLIEQYKGNVSLVLPKVPVVATPANQTVVIDLPASNTSAFLNSLRVHLSTNQPVASGRIGAAGPTMGMKAERSVVPAPSRSLESSTQTVNRIQLNIHVDP